MVNDLISNNSKKTGIRTLGQLLAVVRDLRIIQFHLNSEISRFGSNFSEDLDYYLSNYSILDEYEKKICDFDSRVHALLDSFRNLQRENRELFKTFGIVILVNEYWLVPAGSEENRPNFFNSFSDVETLDKRISRIIPSYRSKLCNIRHNIYDRERERGCREHSRWMEAMDKSRRTPGYEMAPCQGDSGFSGRSAMGGRKVRTGRF